MTTATGRALCYCIALALLLLGPAARAAVNAAVDRNNVALGDTLVLTLTATADENLQGVDTSHLAADFEILSSNTRSSISIINGTRTEKRELTLEIAPRRTGVLAIPPFSISGQRTQALRIQVRDAPQMDPGSETVLFSAEVDRKQVYVQGQVLLTLRIQQSINLDRPAISELKIDDAFVVQLEQKSFQRRIRGRLWLVQEVRYALFPEHSGTLVIPEQEFTARESSGHRSLFDPTPRGRLVRRSAGPLQVEVLPRPLAFNGGDWLPARDLQIEEGWSSDPDQLRVGESVTRTIRLRGEGLQGAQLPPVLYRPQDGVKFYPDQPNIEDREIGSGLLGVREDSVAIVPTRTGTLELPAVEIPWWDIESDSLKTAILPARTVHVGAAGSAGAAAPGNAQQTGLAPAAPLAGSTADDQTGPGYLWPALAAFCALGWALTLFLLLRRPRQAGPPLSTAQTVKPGSRAAYRNLLAACTSGAATQARSALITWAGYRPGAGPVTSLAEVRALFNDSELDAALDALEASLYGAGGDTWHGDSLRAAVERLHRQAGKETAGLDEEDLALYPRR
ncbi:protein BatD [Mangrovimicrobium sediminis]|uniref:Protein BatD n=1 Tax=Mangrovimicrobium sediminis TaxID=2562682 RepID=A0A4Z0M513_9GAMM|nr:BatD family protein [Haliea sp. SAOS-164]TGD74783.1 protein BatD [Haliea sp. SAOS-164]